MLWDLIRDFFVQHVFGGCNSDGTYYNATLGNLVNSDDDWAGSVTELRYKVGQFLLPDKTVIPTYMSLGDWLSTTATIISITIIVVLCCLFVYKIIKLIGGLIR